MGCRVFRVGSWLGRLAYASFFHVQIWLLMCSCWRMFHYRITCGFKFVWFAVSVGLRAGVFLLYVHVCLALPSRGSVCARSVRVRLNYVRYDLRIRPAFVGMRST